jgi:hypothetical protein
MLHYWLTVIIKAVLDSLAFSGQTWQGVTFLVIAFVVGIVRDVKKVGRAEAVKKLKDITLDGLISAFVAFMFVLLVNLLLTPVRLQNDEASRRESAVRELETAKVSNLICAEEVKGIKGREQLLQDQVTSQQTLISVQQTNSTGQQAAVNQCVGALVKVAAPGPQRFIVTAFTIPGIANSKRPASKGAAIVLQTNKAVRSFKAEMSCATDFTILESILSEGVFQHDKAPPGNDHRSYLLDYGTENFTPEDMILLIVIGDNLQANTCTFTLR